MAINEQVTKWPGGELRTNNTEGLKFESKQRLGQTFFPQTRSAHKTGRVSGLIRLNRRSVEKSTGSMQKQSY